MAARSGRFLMLGTVGIAFYALIVFACGKLGWQHLGLLVLAWTCSAPQRGARAFMLGWWPVVLFWLGYDSMRLFAESLLPRVAVEAPYQWEKALFPAPTGEIWPFLLTRWRETHHGMLALSLSLLGNVVYFSHIFGVPLILMILWLRKRTLLFRRLVWGLTVLHIAALAIYLAYPAAPPWWVYENGMVRPTASHQMPSGADKGAVPRGLFNYSANKFAAIPSLHGAYPLLLTAVLVLHGARPGCVALAAVYAAAMWAACVFLNQHYIIDLVIGALLVPLGLPAARRPPDHLAKQA